MTNPENAITELNFTVNLDEFREFYETLTTKYADRKWTWEDNIEHVAQAAIDVCETESHTVMHGWPLQSNLADKSIPPTITLSKYPTVAYYNIDMMHGFAEKLYNLLPFTYRWVLFVLPPGGRVVKHVDKNEMVVHIPLQWDKDALFIFGDEPNTKAFTLPANGKAYLADVSIPHETINNSDRDRIGLIFRLNPEHVDELKRITGSL